MAFSSNQPGPSGYLPRDLPSRHGEPERFFANKISRLGLLARGSIVSLTSCRFCFPRSFSSPARLLNFSDQNPISGKICSRSACWERTGDPETLIKYSSSEHAGGCVEREKLFFSVSW